MATPAPLAEAGDAITYAMRAEARRLADELRWRLLLTWADQLLERLEQLNLDDQKKVPESLGRRIVALELQVELDRHAPPEKVPSALDRVYRTQQHLFKRLQPWWWDFHTDELAELEDADPETS